MPFRLGVRAAAVDGDLTTVWLGDRNLEADRRRLDLRFERPLRVGQIRVWPHADARGATESVRISVNGGDEREVELRPGENRIELGGEESRLALRQDLAERGL